jgi:DnaD/phage-associated family protein
MRGFGGFPPGKANPIRVPGAFFSDLLPLIDDLTELKLTVYCFWALHQREGDYRYLRLRDLHEDAVLLAGLAERADEQHKALTQALERAVARGTLLHVHLPGVPGEDLYFMNTERGRKAVAALEAGDWQPGDMQQPVGLIVERPTIFALYEQNIGPLTPLLGDMLRDAEATYPPEWIADAMKIAVENNKRSWRYVEAILKGWATEGRYNRSSKNTRADGVNPYLQDEYFRRRDDE